LSSKLTFCNFAFQDHAAVFALRGRRSTMEDRFVLIKIHPEMGSGAPVVMHAVLDGHGGEVTAAHCSKVEQDSIVYRFCCFQVLSV
jgi:serine/threonine protein phosphatase PrpC